MCTNPRLGEQRREVGRLCRGVRDGGEKMQGEKVRRDVYMYGQEERSLSRMLSSGERWPGKGYYPFTSRRNLKRVFVISRKEKETSSLKGYQFISKKTEMLIRWFVTRTILFFLV